MPTKIKILQCAEALFFRYGIKSVTMDDIAKELAVSKKTIYQHFSDKNAIVHSLMIEKLKEDERDFKCIADESKTVIEEAFGFMNLMTKIFSTINPNVFYDMQKYHPTSWDLFVDFKEKFICNMVEESLEKGKTQGLVRSEINTKIFARLRMQEIEMAFNPKIFPPAKFKLLEVRTSFLEHFLYGVCTLKGHKLINKLKHLTEEE